MRWSTESLLRAGLAGATLLGVVGCLLVSFDVGREGVGVAIAVVPHVLVGTAGIVVAVLADGVRWDRLTRPAWVALAIAGTTDGAALAVRLDAGWGVVLIVPGVTVCVGCLWLLGWLVGVLGVLPLGAVGAGLFRLCRGDRNGALLAALGLWFLSIGLYPTFLGLAADGPRRSLGLPPLLGIESSAWEVHHPGLLWPARAFAVLVWVPVLAVVTAGLWFGARRRPGTSDPDS